MMAETSLGWFGIARLGLVQTSLGAIVVLTTSTINRVMIVELSMLAIIPGVLVAWHYALQILRPRWGHGSDNGGKRTPWIIGGMATLAFGGFLAAAAVWLAASHFWTGLGLAALAFTLIGIGVGAAGTSLLVLLAETVKQERRGAAATVVWTMMIAGFILTTVLAGKFLDPFSLQRLMTVAAVVTLTAFVVSAAAVWGLEDQYAKRRTAKDSADKNHFGQALRDVWQDGDARRFAIFIFLSMLAYSAQDLILEPFAGLLFNYTPGQSTALTGTQNSGVLTGMILVGIASSFANRNAALAQVLSLRNWNILGCLCSAVALIGLAYAAKVGAAWPLKANVFALGFSNGMFAVAAIGSMFSAAAGQSSREGIRMGLFGASQAIAFAAGGFIGTVLADVLKYFTQSTAVSYGTVFGIEAALFIVSALLAVRIGQVATTHTKTTANPLVLAAQHDLG
jgi:MFS transporter, BCD family, chlorophyll transporter